MYVARYHIIFSRSIMSERFAAVCKSLNREHGRWERFRISCCFYLETLLNSAKPYVVIPLMKKLGDCRPGRFGLLK